LTSSNCRAIARRIPIQIRALLDLEPAQRLSPATRDPDAGQVGLNGALVVAEVAATVVLLLGAGLLGQTVYKMRYVGLGLRREKLLTLRTMARQYWPGVDAVGKQFKNGDPDSDIPWITVVGIVGDVRQMGLDASVKAEMYFPDTQATEQPWFPPRDLVVRTVAEPMSLVPRIKHEIAEVDPKEASSTKRWRKDASARRCWPRHEGDPTIAMPYE
jgi:hypothetical protein